MNAIRYTLLIFLGSIPFLVFLGLLSLFYFNNFIGLWFLSPYDYPFSFAIALFISLTSSTIIIWIFKQQRKDFHPLIVVLGISSGCLLRLNTNLTFELAFISYLSMFFGLLSLGFVNPELAIASANAVKMILGTIAFYVLPLLSMFISCIFQTKKPFHQSKRLWYASPIIVVVLVFSFSTFATNFFSPGLIIPTKIRDMWGYRQFSHFYEKAIEEIKLCPLIKDTLGEIEATALAEGKNSLSMDLDGDDWATLTLEVVGKRGTAIVSCNTDAYCPLNIHEGKTRFKSNYSQEKLYYSQCSD